MSVARPRSSTSPNRAPKMVRPLRGHGTTAAWGVEALAGTDVSAASPPARRAAGEPPFRVHDSLYLVVPFDRAEAGDLVPLAPIWVTDGEAAERRAFEAAVRHAGAIAFACEDTSNADRLDVVAELVTYGEVVGRVGLTWSPDRTSMQSHIEHPG